MQMSYRRGSSARKPSDAGQIQTPQQASRASTTVADSSSPEDSSIMTSKDHRSSSFSVTRGKGEYVCQYGVHCDKGGVLSDGTLVKFERNSAFK